MSDSPPRSLTRPFPPTHPLRDRLAKALRDQADAWQLGERPTVEAILSREAPLAGDAEAVLHLIFHEVILRERVGDTPRQIGRASCRERV